MNAEEEPPAGESQAPRNLADEAALWVPPWARQPDKPIEPAAPAPVPEVPVEPAAPELIQVDEPEPPVEEPRAEDPAEVEDPADAEEPVAEEPAEVEEPAAEAPAEVEEPAAEAPVEAEPESERTEEEAEPVDLAGPLEAILLVVDEPVSEVVLAQVLEQPTQRVTAALEELASAYADQARGFDLRRAAGGWRLYTRGDYASYVERFVLDGQQIRLTQAALETLAVVAYKQPVTRSRISAIRGINCDSVVRTLVTRGLVEECGSEPESGAFLYRTTPLFLEKLGLDSLDQLPPLAPFLPDDVHEIADGQG